MDKCAAIKLPIKDRIEILKTLGSVVPRDKAHRIIRSKYPNITRLQDYCAWVIRREVDTDLVDSIVKEDPDKYVYFKLLRTHRQPLSMSLNDDRFKQEKFERFILNMNLQEPNTSSLLNNTYSEDPNELNDNSIFLNNYFETFLMCKKCNNRLVDEPVTLPCGETICLKHLKDMEVTQLNQVFLKCQMCSKLHLKPAEGFLVNKTIENLLNSKLAKDVKSVKEAMFNLKTNVNEFVQVSSNPLKYIDSYFLELESKLSKRRIDLSARLNTDYLNLLAKINNERKNCELLYKHSSRTDQVQEIKSKLAEFEKQLEEIGDKNYESIKNEVERNSKVVEELILDFKESLLQNKEFELDASPIGDEIENLLGSFLVKDNLNNSRKRKAQ